MFNYKKMCFTKIYSILFSYSTDKTVSPCANSRYTQCLKCFSYLLTAVYRTIKLYKSERENSSRISRTIALIEGGHDKKLEPE